MAQLFHSTRSWTATEIVTAVVVAVTPLALITGVFLSHDVIPKLVVILGGAGLLLFLIPQWSAGLKQLWAGAAGRWFLILLIAQCVSLIVSAALSSQAGVSLVGTTWRRFGALEQIAALAVAAAVASVVATRPGWTTGLFRALTLCGGVAALYGISQYFGFDPFLDPRLYTIDYLGGIVRPPATMGHAIYFAAYLVPVALISGWSAAADPSRRWRVVHAVTALLAPLAILLSGSRGSLLAVLGGAVFLLIGMRPPVRRLVAGAALVLAITAGVAVSPAGANLRNRVAQWRDDPGTARLGVWRDTPALIAKSPLFGSGPDTFATAFRAIESADLSRAYPDFIHETPHNALIDAICGQGILGLAILVGALVTGPRTKGSPGLRAALTGMLIGCVFASLTLITFLYLWTIAGLLAASGPEIKKNQMPGPIHNWLRAAAVFAGAMFIVVAVVLAIQDAAYADLRSAVEAKDSAGATTSYERATSFGIGLPGYELWSSQQLAVLGRALGNTPAGALAWKQAGVAAALAQDRGEDRFTAAYQLSILAIVKSDLNGAEAKAREAISLSPNWYKAHLLRSQILQAMGRNEEAAREADLSRSLGWKQK